MAINSSRTAPISFRNGARKARVATKAIKMRNSTAAPVPRNVALPRRSAGKVRQAIAIKMALSPLSSRSIRQICSTGPMKSKVALNSTEMSWVAEKAAGRDGGFARA